MRKNFKRSTLLIQARPKELSSVEKYREELVKINEKSQDSFENQLSYIAAGGIGITVAFISDIIPISGSKFNLFLFIGWLLLTATLFINLYSHTISFKCHRLTINEIDCGNYSPEQAIKRNKKIATWNQLSVWSLTTGIVSILLFIVINMLLMSKEIKTHPNQDLEKKGRESTTQPPSVKTQPDSFPKPHTGRETITPPPIPNPNKQQSE